MNQTPRNEPNNIIVSFNCLIWPKKYRKHQSCLSKIAFKSITIKFQVIRFTLIGARAQPRVLVYETYETVKQITSQRNFRPSIGYEDVTGDVGSSPTEAEIF